MENSPVTSTDPVKEEWNKPSLKLVDIKTETLFDVVVPGADAYTSNS
jgi:hypothetical protein